MGGLDHGLCGLSRDILTCTEDDIPGTEVLYTIIGGKVLYKKGG